MNQNTWGPLFWDMLHITSLNYPLKPTDEQKENMRQFLLALGKILPCRYCRLNYDRHLREIPMRLDSRKDLACWLIDVHNEVNGKEGKRCYSYEEVMDKYRKILDKELSLTENDKQLDLHIYNHYPYWLYLLFIVVFIFIGYLLYTFRKSVVKK